VLKLDRQRDLAHVRIVDRLPAAARVVPLATAPPAVGQDVFTVGHPKTEVWSCGEGKIARIRPDHGWSYDDGITRRATAIQTQAPVNPGSSGGPLLDRAGAIVGIVVGPAVATRGVSYAVSIQHVHDLLR
jgi:S1-C subfamily serine protease